MINKMKLLQRTQVQQFQGTSKNLSDIFFFIS